MKQFRCGDVVPGCTATFHGSEQEILAEVAGHARRDHQMTDIGTELGEAVRAHMHAA